MSFSAGTRELVRRRAEFRCEFCGVHETDVGGELTIDHYRPRAQGGVDDPDNLIYACHRCNLYKHDYWPSNPDSPRLWNPREESFGAHLVQLPDGILEPRSPTGAFTLRQLRLNRPQLVANRQRWLRVSESYQQLGVYRGIVAVLDQLLALQSTLADQQNRLLHDLREVLKELHDSRR